MRAVACRIVAHQGTGALSARAAVSQSNYRRAGAGDRSTVSAPGVLGGQSCNNATVATTKEYSCSDHVRARLERNCYECDMHSPPNASCCLINRKGDCCRYMAEVSDENSIEFAQSRETALQCYQSACAISEEEVCVGSDIVRGSLLLTYTLS